MMHAKRKRRSGRRRQTVLLADAFTQFMTRYGGHERLLLHELWSHWSVVLGPDLASLGFPLGHKDDVLHIGVEDSMALQEFSMQKHDVLQRVNAFMDKDAFKDVKVFLLQGKAPLLPERIPSPPQAIPEPAPQPPSGFGNIGEKLDPDSPIARCYQAYKDLFK